MVTDTARTVYFQIIVKSNTGSYTGTSMIQFICIPQFKILLVPGVDSHEVRAW